jgi:DNA-binding response OmpR family regulator
MPDKSIHKTIARVLVVDDDPEIASMLARALARHGFSVETTDSGDRALELMNMEPFDAAIVDLVMPDCDGMELASALHRCAPAMPIAMCTGFQNSPLVGAAERTRLTVFRKPVEIREIVEFLDAELRIHRD